MATPVEAEAAPDHLAGTRAAFAEAVAAQPSSAHDGRYRFAGRPARLRAVGSELVELLTRCFEVQAGGVTGSEAGLTIHAWDRAATGVGCPGIPHAPDSTDVLGPGLVTQYAHGQVVRYERPDVVKVIDRRRQEIFICVADAKGAGLSDRSKPFPHVLATWYLDRGVHVLHAGLVAKGGRGLLLGGAAGAGKSTTALACGLSGFDVLGDDAVGTEVTDRGCLGHSIYSTVRFDDDSLRLLPGLAAHSVPPGGPADRHKHLAHLIDLLGRVPEPTVELAAIVTPVRIEPGPTTVVPARRPDTLRRLAPSTLLRGLGAGAAGMAQIAELVRRLPCYELRLGNGVVEIPQVIGDLLVELDR